MCGIISLATTIVGDSLGKETVMPHMIIVSCSESDAKWLRPHEHAIGLALRKATMHAMPGLVQWNISFTIVPFVADGDEFARFQILAISSYSSWPNAKERKKGIALLRSNLAKAWADLPSVLKIHAAVETVFEERVEVWPFMPDGKWGLFCIGQLEAE